MQAFLDHLGHEVSVAHDGHDAHAALSEGNFDVALLDIHLPAMTGLEVVAALRGEEGPVPYLVAATAMARSDGEEHYRAQGFDAYLGKPVQLKDLEAVLLKAGRH